MIMIMYIDPRRDREGVEGFVGANPRYMSNGRTLGTLISDVETITIPVTVQDQTLPLTLPYVTLTCIEALTFEGALMRTTSL